VAHIIEAHRKLRPQENLIVVVSAMGHTTDDLIELAEKVSPRAHESSRRREMDMLLSTGERISMALLSLALADRGLDALSLTGSQSGILTSDFHGEARIQEIKPIRIEEALLQNRIVIVAGFQGVSAQKEITTLGRGGSDTSAVALGARFKAREVYIYTDVDGLYNADPRLVPAARAHSKISYRCAYVSALLGAAVLHHRCIEVAARYQIPVRVLSSFLEAHEIEKGDFMKRGTLMTELGESNTEESNTGGSNMEAPYIQTLNHLSGLSRLHIPNANTASQQSLETLKKLQDSKLSWVNLQQESSGELAVLCKTSLLPDFLKIFPEAQHSSDWDLLSFVGCGLTAAPQISSKIMEIFSAHRTPAKLLSANDESLLFLIPSKTPMLNALLPKLFELL
jgi:aspartate kinase